MPAPSAAPLDGRGVHTPGPWQTNGSHVYSSDPDRALIAQVMGSPVIENLRLIAAAPDLLEALREMVEQMSEPANAEHTLGAFVLGSRFADARAAIARATGSTP